MSSPLPCVLLLVLLTHLPGCLANPSIMNNLFGNNVTDRPPAWHAEPKVRGTFGLLSTCTLTLALCAWTALHLNVDDGRSIWVYRRRKCYWLLIALFFPDFVAWTAYQQHKDARELTKCFDTLLQQEPQANSFGIWVRKMWKNMCVRREVTALEQGIEMNDLEASTHLLERPQRNRWTDVHSHFALMGGFAIDTSAFQENFIPGRPARLCLTARAVRFLAERDISLLPDVASSTIQDKSKANGLAKLLVCAQALWFCLQCVSRVIQGLSITLLELNTFAHALCAFLIYLFWWNKPLEVEEPLLLDSQGRHQEEYERLAAVMTMARIVFDESRRFPFSVSSHAGQYDSNEHVRVSYNCHTPVCTSDLPIAIPLSTEEPHASSMHSHARLGLVDLSPFRQPSPRKPSKLGSFIARRLRRKSVVSQVELEPIDLGSVTILKTGYQLHGFCIIYPRGIELDLTPCDVWCMRLASDFARHYHKILGEEVTDDLGHRVQRDPLPHIALRIRNWPDLRAHNKSLCIAFAVAGLGYGLFHLVAWNALFPSTRQQLYWRLAATDITVSPAFLAVFLPWVAARFNLSDHWKGCSTLCLFYWFGLAAMVGGICYPIARAYLVVESFIQVAYLPPSALLVPQWSSYLPHIG
jgi:hypothetical protein